MKKLRFIAVGVIAIALSACSGENSSAYKRLKSQYDSIDSVNRMLIETNNSAEALISEVMNNFNTINESEQNIDFSKASNGELRRDQKEKIRDNIRLINEKLAENRSKIEELENRLKKSGSKNARLAKIVADLRSQLDKKEADIKVLYDQIEKQNKQIGLLDSTLQIAKSQIDAQKATNDQQAQKLTEQDKAMHTISYCIGTKDDLKDMGILKSGHLTLDQGTNNSYFKKVDYRNLSSIPLNTTKAELLTTHDPSSYELVRGTNRDLVLVIKDPSTFWNNSRTLVVMVK